MSPYSALPTTFRDYIAQSGVALAVSEMAEDAPLSIVNRSFCELTGYAQDEVVGKNCRFLQGTGTSEAQRQALHDFVHGAGDDNGRFPILNYRKDGTSFHNFVFMSRVRFILASQFDMSSAMQRSRIAQNDAQLAHALTDLDQIGREFGLAMMGSAQLIADSVAMMARLSFDDNRR